MRIILTSLLLLVGFKHIIARSLPWYRRSSNAENWWQDYDYDLFRMPLNYYNDDFTKFVTSGSSEESKEILTSSTTDNDDVLSYSFGNMLGSVLPISDKSTDINKLIPTDGDDIKKSNPENDKNDGKVANTDDDDKIIQFEIHLSNNFETKDPNSSEEKKTVDIEENNSSEETLIFSFKDDKSNENSKESKLNKNVDVEMIDLTKFSKEINNDARNDIADRGINDLAYFFITLNILDELMKTETASKNPEYTNDDTSDNELKTKEVDQYLTLFSAILDTVLKDEIRLKETKYIRDEQDNSNDNEDDGKNNSNTTEKQSDEDDDNATAPKNDSDEADEDNKDDNKYNTNNASNSNEDQSDLISLVFHGIDEDDKERKNLNDLKYVVEGSTQNLEPTSDPFLPESISTPTSDNQKAIHQYVKIREILDTQQDSLQKNDITLDKDFYTIIGNNYDDESVNKFENDIYAVHENLDRIKRNINAMQNLQSKLHFHKLITAALKDAQNKSQNYLSFNL